MRNDEKRHSYAIQLQIRLLAPASAMYGVTANIPRINGNPIRHQSTFWPHTERSDAEGS